jgi:hypothetical protein
MIIDESLSGLRGEEDVIRQKLVEEDGVILSLSPFVIPRPYATQYVLPSPVFGETVTDLVAADEGGRSVYAVTLPLRDAAEEFTDTFALCDLLGRALRCNLPAEGKEPLDLLKERLSRALASGRGTVFSGATGESTPASAALSVEEVWPAVAGGGCWVDGASLDRPVRRVNTSRVLEGMPSAPSTFSVEASDASPLLFVRAEDPSMRQAVAISPLVSKLYQESNLRLNRDVALVHPVTAKQFGLSEGQRVVLQAESGTFRVRIALSNALRPGVMFARVATESGSPEVPGRPPIVADGLDFTRSIESVRILKA